MSVSSNKPSKSGRKAKGDGHLRRAEILDAAKTIFTRTGYEGTTIRKIAEEVGVSSTALYMHFRDKDEILIEICSQAMAGLFTEASDASPSAPVTAKGDAMLRARRVMDAYIRFGLDNANAYRLVFCAPKIDQALAERTYRRFQAVAADIASERGLRHADETLAARFLWSGCHGLVSLSLGEPVGGWSQAQALQPAMIDSLLQGVLAS
ncbi:MAG: TetR/AcrR family transcriptional regulator [Caulobacteraceae bacterium]|nr:TetR/AcrR family transcriptional regulator [Caulobacteraceae bacterium]